MASSSSTAELKVELRKFLDPQVSWEDITCILWHNELLYTSVTSVYDTTSGCNGKVNVWDKELCQLGEFEAHSYALYYMCSGPEDTIYTCAADSTICHWRIQKLSNSSDSKCHLEYVKLALLKGHLEPPWKMQFFNNRLYSGDAWGEIRLWENDTYKGVMETFEEIWDLVVIPRFIFTVRNLDVTITTMPDADSLRKACSIRNMIPGRGPLFISKERIFCLHRTTFDIQVHSITETGNPLLATMKGHDSLVTGFVGTEDIMFSGDYDGCIIAWDLGRLCQIFKLRLNDEPGKKNGCVNVMTFDRSRNIIYAAQENKSLIKISLVLHGPE